MKETLKFLEEDLGHAAEEYRYDPHDETHLALTRTYWRTARHIVDRALGRYLG